MDILFYALIAVFLAYKLYTVLGQRHEGEDRRPSPLEALRKDRTGPVQDQGKPGKKEDLFALPLAQALKDAEAQARQEEPLLHAEPAPLSLAGGLHAIRKADPSFDEKNFLKGARIAFEMIVHSFASGERAALKNLLSSGLCATFLAALDAREARGERHEMRTLVVLDADITAARLEGKDALVTVQFVSDQARVIYDKDGHVLQDPGRQSERLTDLWTFRRALTAQDPNWKLVDTRAA